MKTEKPAILDDAIRVLTQLRAESQELKETNEKLLEEIKCLKVSGSPDIRYYAVANSDGLVYILPNPIAVSKTLNITSTAISLGSRCLIMFQICHF